MYSLEMTSYTRFVKKILFPTDFSGLSRRALEYTVAYLQDQKEPYRLVLLNTYYPPESFVEDQVIQKHDEARQQSLVGLKKELQFLENISTRALASFETISQLGTLENVIDRLIKSQDIDTVIMAREESDRTKQMNKLKNILCPVFLIPSKATYPDMKNIETFKL